MKHVSLSVRFAHHKDRTEFNSFAQLFVSFIELLAVESPMPEVVLGFRISSRWCDFHPRSLFAGARFVFFFPEARGEGVHFFSFFFSSSSSSLHPRELWGDRTDTPLWDWCYCCARWSATAARARPQRPPRRPAGTRSRTWGGWRRSWSTWREVGVTEARERKPRRQRRCGAPLWNRRIYATWKQTEGIRLSVSGGLICP